jgi:quercetin dioxygenase-like cupin family protein
MSDEVATAAPAGIVERSSAREQIDRIQAAMIPIRCEMPEAIHHFAPGMYGREFHMQAGMTVVGKIHKHGHLMMVAKGRATVVDEFGKYEVAAGFVQASRPGAKRVVYAHEDTIFVTVHLNPSDTQDLEAIEADHIEPESEEMQRLFAEHPQEALQ